MSFLGVHSTPMTASEMDEELLWAANDCRQRNELLYYAELAATGTVKPPVSISDIRKLVGFDRRLDVLRLQFQLRNPDRKVGGPVRLFGDQVAPKAEVNTGATLKTEGKTLKTEAVTLKTKEKKSKVLQPKSEGMNMQAGGEVKERKGVSYANGTDENKENEDPMAWRF